MTDPKDLNYYLTRPYTIRLVPDEDGTWFAEIPELPGCMTVGDSKLDALEMLEDAKLTWVSGALLAGDIISEPEKIVNLGMMHHAPTNFDFSL